MKKILGCFLLLLLPIGCAATPRYEMREFPSYRLGVVEVAWLDPTWRVDIVVGEPEKTPDFSFTLLPGWRRECVARTDEVSVQAKAWIWNNGQKLVVAKTAKPLRIKAATVRDWEGYGWRVVVQSGDFVAGP